MTRFRPENEVERVRWPDLQAERALQAQGFARIAGIDEAGRGAWAGPVVAAAVALPLDRPDLAQVLDGVRDSKLCTPRRRDELFDRIRQAALSTGVGSVPPERVDEVGIVAATRQAMGQAVGQLDVVPDALLIDALRLPDLSLPQRSLIKGDAHSLSIAAASIVAKVTRDRAMVALDVEYGGYGFGQHKCYGTRRHQQALACLGPSPVHRLSFAPLRKLTGETDEPLRVLTYNIHHWHGGDGHVDAVRLADVIASAGADVVGLNEVFHPLTSTGETRDLLSRTAARLGMAFAFGPTNAYSDWGHVAGPYGNGLLSRYPIRSTQTIPLPHTPGHYRRAVLRAELAVGRETWVAYVTHLNHLSEHVRDREAAALLEVVARFGDDLHLLLGDFNTLAPEDYAGRPDALQRQEAEMCAGEEAGGCRELLPLRVVPRMLAAGYVDAWAAAAEDGQGATWPAPAPQVRVDYLFLPPAMQERLLACRVLDGESVRQASDHRPVLAEFRLKCVDPSCKV
jgi:ribonuclease HII